MPSQGSSLGSPGSLDYSSSGNSINSVGSGTYPSGDSGNTVASAGVVVPSSDTASNTGGACSTPNGQGTRMSISGGCSGGSFVPGYCAADSAEVYRMIADLLNLRLEYKLIGNNAVLTVVPTYLIHQTPPSNHPQWLLAY